MYWAQQDVDQAFLNDEPVKGVSKTSELRRAVVGCDWSWDLTKRDLMYQQVGKFYKHIRAFKGMGSAAADLASLAVGEIDVFCIPGIKPWDVAASALIVEKAGGKITTPDGGEWNVFEPDILATNGILHDRVLELLNDRKTSL